MYKHIHLRVTWILYHYKVSALANAGLLEEKLQNRELKTKGSQEAALGALGNSTLLRKGLLHSGLGGFDKLIKLSFLLPRHSCHSKLACTPKRCLFQMQNFSVFWCGRLLFPGSRTKDAGNSVSSAGLLLRRRCGLSSLGSAPSRAHIKWQIKRWVLTIRGILWAVDPSIGLLLPEAKGDPALKRN